ncbi:MAG: CAP domain-containing protein [Chloroflexi bacterium]|nr:CAP domain-containing protein [Chloroflexota bacterium]
MPLYLLRVVGQCIVVFLLIQTLANAQSVDPIVDLLTRINRERVARGLTPYALNAKLSAAAQSHANDLAHTGKYRSPNEGHAGSNGSSALDRVASVGYGAFSWGRRVGENWANAKDPAAAFSMWMDSAPHRNNILHSVYRELGIGAAKAAEYGYIYILDFGAQPNVLPFFINDGSAETRTVAVTLTLGDEQASPGGDGSNNIGHPTEVQISNSADFAGSKWQPYAVQVNWTLPSKAGTQTVYVKYRDAKGRTATASDSIALNIPVTPSPSPTRTLTRTPRPTNTATTTSTVTRTLTPSPSETPTLTPTEISTSTPTVTPTETSTSTPTVTPTLIIIAKTPTAQPSPTTTVSVIAANALDASAIDASSIIGAIGFAIVAMMLVAVFKDTGIRN